MCASFDGLPFSPVNNATAITTTNLVGITINPIQTLLHHQHHLSLAHTLSFFIYPLLSFPLYCTKGA